ncbi:MAG: hypothetical protein Satyrvirus44_7, partial [Satyrvirus sp.]
AAKKYFSIINETYLNTELEENDYVNPKMFDLFFHRFIKCNTLQRYYQQHSRSNEITSYTNFKPIEPSLNMHPSAFFDENGIFIHPNIFDPFAVRFDYTKIYNNPNFDFNDILFDRIKKDNKNIKTFYDKYKKYKQKYLNLLNRKN